MNKNIDEVEFTIFDTETTGLEPGSGDRIVEIAAIRIKGKDKIAVFETLVNPGREISEAAQRVNNITAEMLEGAPSIEAVMPKFLNFIEGTCVSSYNASFDMAFLQSELKLLGREPLNIPAVDILRMAKRLLPGLERYPLWFVAQKLSLTTKQEHRALADVELTLGVFNRLNEVLKIKQISDFNSFISLFGISSGFLEDIHNQKFSQIQKAIDLGVKLKIRYLSGSSAQVSEREVIPKEIKQDKGRSYLVGHCCLRQEERTFRIDAILHLEIV